MILPPKFDRCFGVIPELAQILISRDNFELFRFHALSHSEVEFGCFFEIFDFGFLAFSLLEQIFEVDFCFGCAVAMSLKIR